MLGFVGMSRSLIVNRETSLRDVDKVNKHMAAAALKLFGTTWISGQQALSLNHPTSNG